MPTRAARINRHLWWVILTFSSFLVLNRLNELLFSRFEYTTGVNWFFLPAGIRLLSTLLFGLAGFEGLVLAGLYLNFYHFAFADPVRAWTGALAGAIGPYLAYLFAKHWFSLGAGLQGLTSGRLAFLALLCGVMSPLAHLAFAWAETGEVDLRSMTAMMIGDIVGIVIVLYAAKALLGLRDRWQREA
jgi:hypothetical protein